MTIECTETLSQAIAAWYMTKNPMRVTGPEPDEIDLDWLLDRVTMEFAKQVSDFDALAFVRRVDTLVARKHR